MVIKTQVVATNGLSTSLGGSIATEMVRVMGYTMPSSSDPGAEQIYAEVIAKLLEEGIDAATLSNPVKTLSIQPEPGTEWELGFDDLDDGVFPGRVICDTADKFIATNTVLADLMSVVLSISRAGKLTIVAELETGNVKHVNPYQNPNRTGYPMTHRIAGDFKPTSLAKNDEHLAKAVAKSEHVVKVIGENGEVTTSTYHSHVGIQDELVTTQGSLPINEFAAIGKPAAEAPEWLRKEIGATSINPSVKETGIGGNNEVIGTGVDCTTKEEVDRIYE